MYDGTAYRALIKVDIIQRERQDRCLYCFRTKIIKKGKRRKKFETIQLWYCKDFLEKLGTIRGHGVSARVRQAFQNRAP